MVASIVMFTFALVISKEVNKRNPRLTAFEIFTSSTFVQMLFNEVYLRVSQRNNKELKGIKDRFTSLKPRQLRLLTLRLCLGYPAWLMLTYSVFVLPLGLV